MAVNDRVLGERLRVARDALGITQATVAKQLGVSRTTMVAMERGQRAVRPQELLELAQLYGVSANSLLRRGSVHVEVSPQFRKTPSTSQEAQREAVRLLQHLASAYAEVEDRLGMPLQTHYPPPRPLVRNYAQQAADLALSLRQQLGLGLAAIPDAVGVLEERMGLRVFVRPLHPQISEVFVCHDQLGACFLLNANHPPGRRAWSLAHGVGHLLTTPKTAELCLGTNELSERFADAFAAELLLPGAAVRESFAAVTRLNNKFSTRHLIHLAHANHVSREAMARRLESLELLPAGTFEALQKRGALTDKEAEEVLGQAAVEQHARTPSRFTLLCVEAYTSHELSEGQLAELLGVDRLKAREVVDAFGGEAVEEWAL